MLTHPVFFALKVVCGLTYTVEGRENLPAGNHVLFLKHSSTWETYGIMILFPPLVWVMKREIYWIPFVGWGCMLGLTSGSKTAQSWGEGPMTPSTVMWVEMISFPMGSSERDPRARASGGVDAPARGNSSPGSGGSTG